MSEQPWLPLYVSDYLRDTDALDMEESGSYLHLLMAMWARDGTIPDDDRDNARRLKMRPSRWRKIKSRLLPYLIQRDGLLTQKRLQTEWVSAHNRIQKWKENGAKGGRPLAKNKDLAKPEGSILVNPNESIARRNPHPLKESKIFLNDQADLAGHTPALFSEQEIASAKLAYPLVRIEDELSRLIPWARDNWPDSPDVQARKVMASLANKQLALAAAPKNVADRDKPLVVSDALLNSRLMRKTGK